ncbi:3-hydroxybutyrate oligomer hydrolase family protein [Roseateles sp. BYS180W]|uniref:3-hydroxybutyrate oligomer hydrolase family protein n=1 Tax=Roseateles rivi TaxID=3299028 RepID=A0ABW7FRA1_9BURK
MVAGWVKLCVGAFMALMLAQLWGCGGAVNAPQALNAKPHWLGEVKHLKGQPGNEYLTLLGGADPQHMAAVLVQVPVGFNPQQPCIITAAVSASQGVYGQSAAADVGLRNGCAVVRLETQNEAPVMQASTLERRSTAAPSSAALWDASTRRALSFAFFVLNEQYGSVDRSGRRQVRILPGQTVVITTADRPMQVVQGPATPVAPLV